MDKAMDAVLEPTMLGVTSTSTDRMTAYFHENIYNLVLCTSTERFTSREVYFLSAASSKCKVLLIFFALISSILNKLHS